MKKISILGSTGSIGRQTLDIVREHPHMFKVVSLAALKNIEELEKQIKEFNPETAAVFDEEKAKQLAGRIAGTKTKIYGGMKGLIEAAACNNAEMVLNSVVGSIGLIPTLKALENKKNLALANKETLVVAGELVMKSAQDNGAGIIPVDSEHSAIFQCLQGEEQDNLFKIILTASGGPFKSWKFKDIKNASPEDALKHPNWNMGAKITIDSATLMNKGLEVIEARWLFNLEVGKIEVVIHPESIIHSMVQLKDNSIIAQLGMPDMKLPIQYALSYPRRITGNVHELDFKKINSLTFMEPDLKRFPCLRLAYEAAEIGGSMPCVLNAANEILVDLFLQKKISFYDISKNIEKIMQIHNPVFYTSVEELLEIDAWARNRIVQKFG